MRPELFILENKDERRIAVIIAISGEMAYEFIAKEGTGDENASTAHFKKIWKIIDTRPVSMAGTVIVSTYEIDESFEIIHAQQYEDT